MSRFLNHSFATLVCGVPTPHQASHHPRLEAWYRTRGCSAAPASPRTPSIAHKPLMRNHLQRDARAVEEQTRRREPRGFFKQEPLTVEERRERTAFARAWLDWILLKGPMPAREILRLAKLENIPARSLARAKKRLHIVSYKLGGSGQNWGGVWYWSSASPRRMPED